ncbi:hypothetical protein B296_00049522 [Ensete ventricosum]|uniref:Uncharacterized protein n=1 Tax=Ensete ventricosum TaxID=4639 RepID=A0A426YQ90_ENSVE|nr:hypothetical protein B296_00049522 [Ensete ventricosum]
MIPCILLALGGNLIDVSGAWNSFPVRCIFKSQKNSSKCILSNIVPVVFFNLCCIPGPGAGSRRLGLRTTVAIIFGRLVLVPPAGLGIVTVADKLGLFPRDDKMFKFVLLLQHTMPTSVLSGINLHL